MYSTLYIHTWFKAYWCRMHCPWWYNTWKVTTHTCIVMFSGSFQAVFVFSICTNLVSMVLRYGDNQYSVLNNRDGFYFWQLCREKGLTDVSRPQNSPHSMLNGSNYWDDASDSDLQVWDAMDMNPRSMTHTSQNIDDRKCCSALGNSGKEYLKW